MNAIATASQFPQIELLAKLYQFHRSGRLAPSLLFTGKKGVGKWSAAASLAKAIACLNSSDGSCNHCDACHQFDRFSHPDIFYLFPLPKDEEKSKAGYLPYLQQKQQHPFSDGSDDVRSFITIESIRAFQTSLARKPSLSKAKVGIIYEAELMLPAAMDSLLKTLEEPSPTSCLIVITDQPRFLAPTILSRLQRISFPLLDDEYVERFIAQNFEVAEEDAKVLARFAGGTLYNIELLVDKSFFQLRDSAFDLFKNALTIKPPDLMIKYSESSALESREKVEKLLVHWQAFLRDLMILQTSADDKSDNISSRLINYDFLQLYADPLQRVPDLRVIDEHIEKLEQTRNELRRNVNPRMAACNFLFALHRDFS